jgi:hypothetical protein
VIAYLAAAAGAAITWWGIGMARGGLQRKVVLTLVTGIVMTLFGLATIDHYLFHGRYVVVPIAHIVGLGHGR